MSAIRWALVTVSRSPRVATTTKRARSRPRARASEPTALIVTGTECSFDGDASDSVSDLKPGETARWEASVYSDYGNEVEQCDVVATGT